MPDPAEGITPPRRWILKASIAVGLLLVLSSGALFAATRFLDPDQLAQWLEPKIEAALGREVEIDRARVDLFPPVALVLEGLEIASPPGFSGDPFATIGALRLDLSLIQILRRRISVDEVRLAAPEINVVVREDGASNAEGFATSAGSSGSGEPSGAPFQVAIESIRIEDGALTYLSESDGRRVAVSPLSGRFRVVQTAEGGWTIDGTVDARAGARIGGSEPGRMGPYDVQLRARGNASNDLSTLHVEGSSLIVEGLALNLEADLERLEGEGGTLALRVGGTGLDIGGIMSLLPDSVAEKLGSVAGTVGADITYRAELGSDIPPELTGQVRLADVAVSRSPGEPGVSDLVGDIYLTLDSAWTTNLQGTVAGGSARARGLFRTGERGGFVARIAAQPDLGAVGGLVTLPDSVTLAGGLSMDVTARGTLDDLAGVRFSGRVTPEGMRITLPGVGVPVSVPEGTVLIEGDVVRWGELPVFLGQDRFTTSGEVRDVMAWARKDDTVPVVGGDFAGDRFDLDEVFPGPPPDSTILYGHLVFARLGEKVIGGRTPREILEERGFGRPDSLPFAGDLNLRFGTFLSAPYELSDFRARVQFQPNLVQLSDVESQAYGGRIEISADLGMGPDPDQPFSFQLTANQVDAGRFLSATSPLGQVFGGTLTLSMDVSGRMDDVLLPTRSDLLGAGTFSLENGSVHSGALTESITRFFKIPEFGTGTLRTWSAPFLLRDGRVVLKESALEGAFGDPRVAGTVGFGGQLALNLLFQVPSERLDSATFARLGVGQDVLRRMQAGRRPFEAALRVAGTVVEPLLSPDQSGVRQQVSDAIEEEAEAQVQEAIEGRKQELEERATDAVDRILQSEDTSGTEAPALTDLRRLLPPNLFRTRPEVPNDTAAVPDSAAALDSTNSARDSTANPDTLQTDTTAVSQPQ